MEQKKSKVLTVDRFSKADNFGNWSFSIKFENGDEGFYRTKFEDQNYFKVNVETDYNIENKTSQAGKEWFKVTRVEAQREDDTPPQLKTDRYSGPGYIGGSSVAEKRELEKFKQKWQACTIVFAYAKDLCAEGKITKDEVGPTYIEFLKVVLGKIDEI